MQARVLQQVMVTVAVVAAPPPTPSPSPTGQAEYYFSLDPQSGAYKFGYDTGLFQHQSFREETRSEDGGVHGSYGYVDAGVLRITEYTADELGYRCRETVRYLVEPNRGEFVPYSGTKLQPIRQDRHLTSNHQMPEKRIGQISVIDAHTNDNWEGNRYSHLSNPKLSREDWRPHRTAQPARVLGKKVTGLYKDFTNEPAVGGTAAVTPWNYAHKAELTNEEIFGLDQQGDQNLQQAQREDRQRSIGGTPVWPMTEDGVRVVWQPF
ncbi:Cuticle protein 6 [Frankliniella fusca]|uniref:Cuticle protein 6 n=1 Tax=Frankliniella fusca TaxID=407009 RepID=A0AAE1HRS2_9NEOP|nr:Cuticle protein 6 [Frankliniella fusca]